MGFIIHLSVQYKFFQEISIVIALSLMVKQTEPKILRLVMTPSYLSDPSGKHAMSPVPRVSRHSVSSRPPGSSRSQLL